MPQLSEFVICRANLTARQKTACLGNASSYLSREGAFVVRRTFAIGTFSASPPHAFKLSELSKQVVRRRCFAGRTALDFPDAYDSVHRGAPKGTRDLGAANTVCKRFALQM